MVSGMMPARSLLASCAMHGLLIEYELNGTTAVEHAELSTALTPALAAVRGLVSLTWLSNETTGCYGAFYVFEQKPAFDAFVAGELYEALRSRNPFAGLWLMTFRSSRFWGTHGGANCDAMTPASRKER